MSEETKFIVTCSDGSKLYKIQKMPDAPDDVQTIQVLNGTFLNVSQLYWCQVDVCREAILSPDVSASTKAALLAAGWLVLS